jgi:hypothetical protein
MSRTLSRRQASIRGAFYNSYPSCVSLIELIQGIYYRPLGTHVPTFEATKARDKEIIIGLIKGMPYREVAAHFKVSITAIYTAELKFYYYADRFFNRAPEVMPPHTYRKNYAKAQPRDSSAALALINGLPVGNVQAIHNNTNSNKKE